MKHPPLSPGPRCARPRLLKTGVRSPRKRRPGQHWSDHLAATLLLLAFLGVAWAFFTFAGPEFPRLIRDMD